MAWCARVARGNGYGNYLVSVALTLRLGLGVGRARAGGVLMSVLSERDLQFLEFLARRMGDDGDRANAQYLWRVIRKLWAAQEWSGDRQACDSGQPGA